MRSVARVLVVERGHVLAISDSAHPSRVGIPGGGIESGETPRQAARRELREETGLELCEMSLLMVVNGERGRGQMRTFVFCGVARGTVRNSDEGHVFWARPHTLLRGRYREFNRVVFEAAGL